MNRAVCSFLLLLCVACIGVRRGTFEGIDLAPGDVFAPDLTPLAEVRRPPGSPIVAVGEEGARLSIVVADDSRFVAAALHLATTIERMTGFRPTVYRELEGQSATNAPAFYVGASASRRFAAPTDHPEAFRVLAADGSFHFLGRSDFAVYDFCERLLGERCYSADESAQADCIVRTHGLALPPVDYSDRPVFEHRVIGPYGRSLWGRMGKSGSSHRGKVVAHAPTHWFADTNLVAALPQIFALTPDGSRAASPLLCYGNPATFDYYTRRIDEQIAGGRDADGIVDTVRKTISVSPWDMAVACECADCRRLIDPAKGLDGSASDLLWGHFAKRLAAWAKEKHPDYLVCILPYINTCAVPNGLDFAAERNVEAMVCTMPGLALFKNTSCRDREERLIRDWAKATGRKALNWHYVCWPAEFTDAPYVFGHLIRDHYSRMREVTAGSFVNTSGDATRFSLSVYVWMRSLWNPDVDVDAIYDGFARRMFGAAAKPMRRLIALQEAGWAREWPNENCHDSNVFGISYPPRTVRKMRSLLADAWEAAAADNLARTRIAWYAAGFARFFRQAEAWEKGVRPEPLPIRHAANPPTIDGILNEEDWQSAAPRAFVSWNDEDETPPVHPTTVRALWTEKGLLLGFMCVESAIAALDPAAPLVEDHNRDTLKVLIAPTGGETGPCHQFLIDCGGRVVSAVDGRDVRPDGVRAAVHFNAADWTAEVFIPFAAFGETAAPHGWKGNLVRWRVGDGETEWTRLSTRGICRDLDRNAFTAFEFTP